MFLFVSCHVVRPVLLCVAICCVVLCCVVFVVSSVFWFVMCFLRVDLLSSAPASFGSVLFLGGCVALLVLAIAFDLHACSPLILFSV